MSESAASESASRVSAMIKSLSVSSEGSLPPLEDDADSVCSDELLGSQSRSWLADLLKSGDVMPENGDASTVGRDGLFVDYHFPLGELELQAGVKWKRPKVERDAVVGSRDQVHLLFSYFT